MLRRGLPLWVLFVCLGVGCSEGVNDGDEPGDGEHDGFMVDGRADTFGISEWGAEACGILELVNTADLETLDRTVRLNRQAALAIVAYRAGEDGIEGTEDDERIDTLDELDEIAFVGPATFRRIADYAEPCATLTVQLVTVSDWHGQLDPTVTRIGAATVPVGGAAVLSTYFRRARTENPNTLTLTAGDAFGATPPLSSVFDEEPAVLAMNGMGFDADGLGNHNFDRGTAHLERMIALADFPYLSANLENVSENMSCPGEPRGLCVQPYHIFLRQGVRVAVIGVTNEEAPNLTRPGAFGTIEVGDAATAAMAARAQAAQAGADVFVLMAHMGRRAPTRRATPTGPSSTWRTRCRDSTSSWVTTRTSA
jgi:hypothetical protein